MIKLYGVANGFGSRAQVTRGFKQAIEHMGLMTEFCALDQDDGSFDRHGDAAPIAIMTGPIEASVQVSKLHQRRFAMVAPNATKIPKQMVVYLQQYYTDLIVPTQWCRQAVEEVGLPIHVVPHGVFSSEIALANRDRSELLKAFYRKEFCLVHFSTSRGSRKGTVELAEGFQMFRKNNSDWNINLSMVLDDQARARFLSLYDGSMDHIAITSRLDDTYRGSGMRPTSFADGLRIFHAVIQPSRAEAFGLIPLEAMCAGVPVMATCATGHEDYWGYTENKACIGNFPWEDIFCCVDGLIDDCPGAMAPTIQPLDVMSSLERMTVFGKWLTHEWNTIRCRQPLLDYWDWKLQLEPFLKGLADGRS